MQNKTDIEKEIIILEQKIMDLIEVAYKEKKDWLHIESCLELALKYLKKLKSLKELNSKPKECGDEFI